MAGTLGIGGVGVNPFMVPQLTGQMIQPVTPGQYAAQPLLQIQQLLQLVPQQLQQLQQLQYAQQYQLQQLHQLLQFIPAQLQQVAHLAQAAQQQPFASGGISTLPLWSASPQIAQPNYVM